jgi:WD40 repeat protein
MKLAVSSPPNAAASAGVAASDTQGQLVYTYRGHTLAVRSLAWSPNDLRVASGGDDVTVQVWRAVTGDDVLVYRAHQQAHAVDVINVSWSPGGKRIASVDQSGSVKVWDASSGETLFSYASAGLPWAAAWSSDGKYIAVASSDVRVLDSLTGKELFVYGGHRAAVTCVCWSPHRNRVVSGSLNGDVRVWDAFSGHHSNIYQAPGSVWSVEWAPSGGHIALATGVNGRDVAQVIDATRGGPLVTYTGHTQAVKDVSWSPTGRYIVSASHDGTAQIWAAPTARHVYTYKGHTNLVLTAAWSHTGGYIASGGFDDTVQVWRAS